jgi:adenine-specific DNA-methyltransferase
MATKLDQLKSKLRELFQLDRPDLDFGFYRIMHAKQDEIEKFLDKDLLPQVQAGLAALKTGGGDELAEAIKQAEALGVDPDTVPKVKELKAKLGEPVDLAKTEDAIYSHLYRFFSRYYDAGDFISMRRYKEGVYAIPYEGEEVVLHWANKDQYYIKSSENLRDYTVKLAEGDTAPRLHFKLVEADIEKDNRKAADDKKRLFIFNPETVEVTDNEVVLGFEYRPDPENRKQEAFITAAVEYVKEHAADFGPFAQKLLALKPTEKRKDRTVLEKHLTDYTATNSMDYFIHKDLGGFLRRELDFYIKNEVMHLDDIEHETAPRVEQYLAQVRVIRGIAHKLIDFLAQLEDFQKKLWLKKKFVVETNWCITLDRVPETLYPDIAANPAQWAEWEKLGFVEPAKPAKAKKKEGELELGDQTVPDVGTVAYLKAFPFMV